MKPSLAKKIEVVQTPDGFKLTIDGFEFPWFIDQAGVDVGSINKWNSPIVMVPIMAEAVEVRHEI